MGAVTEVTQPLSVVEIGNLQGSLLACQQQLYNMQDSAVVEFQPCIRSGVWYDMGSRQNMEDEHVLIDDLVDYLGPQIVGSASGSYYGVSLQVLPACFFFVDLFCLLFIRNIAHGNGCVRACVCIVVTSGLSFVAAASRTTVGVYVHRCCGFASFRSPQQGLGNLQVFDGHDGRNAAQFVKDKLLKFIVSDVAFPTAVEEAVQHAFLQTDAAFAEACSVNQGLSSGTTAITLLVLGREIFVANAGDCRAVLCRKGKAVEMSRDHKPNVERSRIEALGGFIDDGYLNGQLSVARAIGNWHIKGLKGVNCPLSAEPEVKRAFLTEDDEFMIIGCDGFWDVFTSENAVAFARRKLQQHNDPGECSHELVDEALRRNTSDNLTVVVVCFQRNPPPRLFSRFLVRRQIYPDS